MMLLKLHGSLNWRPKLGYGRPYVVDAITHHEPWFGLPVNDPRAAESIERHLEPEPFLVPPVLLKSALVEQPILRVVWRRAYVALSSAQRIVFIGYSFPITDIAVGTLFDEALKDLPREDISVVNLAANDSEKKRIKTAYRAKLGEIPDEMFDFRGALEWSGDLAA